MDIAMRWEGRIVAIYLTRFDFVACIPYPRITSFHLTFEFGICYVWLLGCCLSVPNSDTFDGVGFMMIIYYDDIIIYSDI